MSSFGIEAVKEMNRLGILMDLSHVGIKTTMDTIEISDNPVSCTHANSKEYYDVPRNKAGDALKLLAEKGGVVGATCITSFLQSGRTSNLRDYVEAIDRLVDSIGVDHVGIGTDFTQDQGTEFFHYLRSDKGIGRALSKPMTKRPDNPIGLDGPAEYTNLTAAMIKRGWSEIRIRKILGENWLAFLEEVWGS